MTIQEFVEACVNLKEKEEFDFPLDPEISLDDVSAQIKDRRKDNLFVLLTHSENGVNAICYDPEQVLKGLLQSVLSRVRSGKPGLSPSFLQLIEDCVSMHLGETKTFSVKEETKPLDLAAAAFIIQIKRGDTYQVRLDQDGKTVTAMCYDPEVVSSN